MSPLSPRRRRTALAALALVSLALGGGCTVPSASDKVGSPPGVPKSALAEDFDGDGNQDVLVGYGNDYLGITLLSQDDYGFWTRSDLPTLVAGSELLASTDVNDDGAPDVIAALKGLDRFSVLTNDGDGNFTVNVKEVVPAVPHTSRITALATATAASGTRLVSVAYETDDPDAYVKPRTVVTYRASNGTLSYANVFQYFDPVPGEARALELADVDLDGRLDLVVGTAAGTVQIYAGTGSDGTFEMSPTTLSVPGRTGAIAALAVGDVRTNVPWSVDGHIDVLAAFADSSEVYGWRGAGGMGFAEPVGVGPGDDTPRRFLDLAVAPGTSGDWGGLTDHAAAAFVHTSSDHDYFDLRAGDPHELCAVTSGTLFGLGQVATPFGAMLACSNDAADFMSVVVPDRQRLAVPASLALGTVRAGSEGETVTANLSPVDHNSINDSFGDIWIDGVVIEGDDADQFELVRANTGACVQDRFSKAPCAPQVRFVPTTPGAKTAQLRIANSAYRRPGSPTHSIELTGTGTGGVASAPSEVAVGDVAVGSSGTVGVTVTNSGNEPLAIASVAVENAGAGWAAQRGTCSSAVAVGASCTAQVNYAPTATGAASGELRIVNDGVGVEPVVALSARGVASGVTAAPVAFGTVAVGGQVTATAEVVNSGNVALTISSVEVAGPDAAWVTVESTDCMAEPIAVAGGCEVELRFAPTVRRALDANLRIFSNAPSSPNTVALSGTALSPEVEDPPPGLGTDGPDPGDGGGGPGTPGGGPSGPAPPGSAPPTSTHAALAAPARFSIARGRKSALTLRVGNPGERTLAGAVLRLRLPRGLVWIPPRKGARRAVRPTRDVAIRLGKLAPGRVSKLRLDLRAGRRARRGKVRLALRVTGPGGVLGRGTATVTIR